MLKTLVLLAVLSVVLSPLAATAAGSAKPEKSKSRLLATHKTKKGGSHPASAPTDPKAAPVEVKNQSSFDQIEIDEGG